METYNDIEKLLFLMANRTQTFESFIEEENKKDKTGNNILIDEGLK